MTGEPCIDCGNSVNRPNGRSCYACVGKRSNASVIRKYGTEGQYRRKLKYGLSDEAYRSMIDGQGGLCAICRKRQACVVDHDHRSGMVRGILCRECNMGIGLLGDDFDGVMAAATYLSGTRDKEKDVGEEAKITVK